MCHKSSPRKQVGGFTLVELLVVIAVGLTLCGIIFSATRSAKNGAVAINCANRLRVLGTATLLYTQDHQESFPRSYHSAASYREPGWAVSIAPYLGISAETIDINWPKVFGEHFRSPSDPPTESLQYGYGMNVFFELDPNGDDYQGSPATWRKTSQCSNPSATILMAQVKPKNSAMADHLMAHLWSSVAAAKNAINHEIHDGKSNYLFVDGHVERLTPEETLAPSRSLNRWNPSLAR